MLTLDSAKLLDHLAIELSDAQKDKQKRILSEAERKRDEVLAMDGGYEVDSWEQQAGRPLHSSKIIEKLTRMSPLVSFERSVADKTKMGIYFRDNISNLDDAYYRGRRFVCGFEAGISPEFSIAHVKEVAFYNEQTEKQDYRKEWAGQVRGWRKVLAVLIKAKIISRSAAEKEFDILKGRESKKWYENLA